MALIVGTNSWVTVSEADEYLENNIHAEAWFKLPETGSPGTISKENVLVTSCMELKSSTLLSLPMPSSNQVIKNAQIEMALFIMDYYEELIDRRASIASGLSSFKYSEREEKYNSRDGGGVPSIPMNILGMLIDYSTENTFADLEV